MAARGREARPLKFGSELWPGEKLGFSTRSKRSPNVRHLQTVSFGRKAELPSYLQKIETLI